ncbi:MAG: hypothetical protein V1744_06365 [Candidatus Altiarchaeota archaeon]
MVGVKRIVALIVVFVLLSGDAAAFSLNDLIDYILGLFGGGGKQPDNVVCNPPYIKVGGKCCLDRNDNRICDKDETTTTQPRQTTQTTQTTQPSSAVTTTLQSTVTTLKTNLNYGRVTLTGTLVNDVDPVLTADKSILVQPTDEASKGSFLDVVDMVSATQLGAVMLSGRLLTGVDAVILDNGKTVLMPTAASPQAYLDVIDLPTKSKVKSLKLAAELQEDVDVQATPNQKNALMATRLDASNSFLEVIDLTTNAITKKVALQGDLKEGVDCLVTRDSGKAVCPTNKVAVGSNLHFIDLASGVLLKVLGVDGALEGDVDLKMRSNDEIILMPTKTPVRGFLSIIEAKTMSIEKKLELSGTLKESVDTYFLPGEKTAYIPVTNGNQGYVDIIDVVGKQVKYSVKLTGDLVKGVDGKHLPDGSMILMPNQKGSTAYLDIIDPSSGTVVKSVQLSGTLQTAVDVQVTEDGKTAYMPVRRPGRGKIDIIDVASGALVKTIDLKADLKEDVDALLTVSTKRIAIPSSKNIAYIDVITNTPANSLTAMTTGMGVGYVDVIDTGSNNVFGSMSLPGDIVVGVDGISGELASTTPDPDEDMTLSLEQPSVTSTTTTIPQQTTTTLWTPPPDSTSTTIPDNIPTTTTLRVTTTTQGAVITPRCGDGYLSTPNSPGGGSEECDLNDNPQYSWAGGNVYPCPTGLECVNCKCVGCGDGRLQKGEECDPNNKKSKVNGQLLWQGQEYACSGQYEYCDSSTCTCESSVQCTGDLYNADNCNGACNSQCKECAPYQQTPCYYCKNRDCSQIDSGGVSLYNTASECNQHCPQGTGQCISWSTCSNCYYCKNYVCGNGAVEPGEQCEKNSDCPSYHTCSQCQCVTDCNGYCGSVGQGFTNYGGIGSSDQCSSQTNPNSVLKQLIDQMSETCYAVCGKGYFMDGLNDNCCCTKTNKVHCLDCPGQNPDCNTALNQCKASIPM